jgi:hypothetical protein
MKQQYLSKTQIFFIFYRFFQFLKLNLEFSHLAKVKADLPTSKSNAMRQSETVSGARPQSEEKVKCPPSRSRFFMEGFFGGSKRNNHLGKTVEKYVKH